MVMTSHSTLHCSRHFSAHSALLIWLLALLLDNTQHDLWEVMGFSSPVSQSEPRGKASQFLSTWFPSDISSQGRAVNVLYFLSKVLMVEGFLRFTSSYLYTFTYHYVLCLSCGAQSIKQNQAPKYESCYLGKPLLLFSLLENSFMIKKKNTPACGW